MYKIVKRYYDKGVYTKDDVMKFVLAGKITEEQYKEIVKEDEEVVEETKETVEEVVEEENVEV